jgi:hypothetical protein
MSNFSGLAMSRVEMKKVKGGQTCHAHTSGGKVTSYGWGGCHGSKNCYTYSC